MNCKHNRYYLTGCLLLFLALPSLSWGDISTDELFELSLDELLEVEVEIATGKPQKLSRAPAVANVITAADIKAMGITDFSQVLAMIPGVHLYPDAQTRLDPHFSIRGIQTVDNAQVLVLVDGYDLSYVYTGSTPNGFRLPVANIARIEVMRSPGSALYGADAFAGVINIITKNATQLDGTSAGWRQGTFNTQDIWLQHGAQLNDRWDLAFSLENSNSDGDRGRVVDYNDEVFGFSGTAPLETRYNVTNTQLTLSSAEWAFKVWNWSLDNAGTGQGVGFIPNPQDSDNYELFLIDIQNRQHDVVIPGLGIDSRLSYEVSEIDAYFVIAPPFGPFTDGYIGNPAGTQRKGVLSVRADYSGRAGHRLLLGAGSEWILADPREAKNFTAAAPGMMVDVTGDPGNVFSLRESRMINHLLLQDEWQVNEAWAVTAGLRYDDYSDFGNTTNPRIAVVWSGLSRLTTKFLYGSAFRAPSFTELYLRNNPAALGNPDVKPESIETYELVFDYRPVRALNLVLSLFSYRIDNLIDRDFGEPAQNRGKQKGTGFELEANWHLNSRLQLRSFYAFQNADDGETGADIPNAPKQQFYINAHWGFQPQWGLGTQLKWIADRKRAAGDPRAEIADYTIVDATLRRRHLLPNMDFALSARNLFDEDIREPSTYDPNNSQGAAIAADFPMAGRSLYAEINFHY